MEGKERPKQPTKFKDEKLEDEDCYQTQEQLAESLKQPFKKQENWVPYELKQSGIERRLLLAVA